MHNNSLSVSICLEYLDQVRTKRRSLDRNELSSSPTREVGEESQGIRYMNSGRNKGQKLVSCFFKTGHFVGY